MGCANCGIGANNNGQTSTDGTATKTMGCNGNCSGGCNRLNVYDWLSDLPFSAEKDAFNIIEVSFKNGSRKGFYRNSNNVDCITGDLVVVEGNTGGFDIGKISMSGELVRLQMKKKNVSETAELQKVLRLPSDWDMDKYRQAKSNEYSTMLMARVIARELGLEMKIGDVEYQGDGRKATFYYTAEDRVDFRELIKVYAKEFRVRIEMRQIGSRQEAGRIGGLGSCGRELCCSTWLTKFKSVSTAAARYQNIAINQMKLSGQCGRLKCCLNYELDIYMDALQDFPEYADFLQTERGEARLMKTDIFQKIMWYKLEGASTSFPIKVSQVKEILAMNKKGEKPESLLDLSILKQELEREVGFEDGVGKTSLAELNKHHRKRNRKRSRNRKRNNNKDNQQNNKRNNQFNKSNPTNNKQQKTNQRPNKKRTNNNNKSKTGKDNKPPQQQQDKRTKTNRPSNRNHRNDDNKKRSDGKKNRTKSNHHQPPKDRSDNRNKNGNDTKN